MTTRWTGLVAGFAALVFMAPCTPATESNWAYRQERASERRYERLLQRQDRLQREADRKYERAMRRIDRAEQRRAYRESQREYRRERWHSYRDSRIF